MSRAAYKREYYKKNKEEILERNLLWKRANNKEHQKALLDSRFKHRYGISNSDYEAMLQEQDGVCKICKGKPIARARLSVDHCHKTGKVRGLLCLLCNSALGKFKDDKILLARAIVYLEETS